MFERWFPQDMTTLRKLLWFRTAWEKSGKPPTPTDPLSTFVGSIVRFFSHRALPVVQIEANFTPIQSLNGQDAPYPPGGGKNLFKTTATSKTQSDVTWTINDDGSITVTGTATGYTDLDAGEAIVAGLSETVTIYGDVSTAGNIVFGSIRLVDSNNQTIGTIYSGGTQTTHTVDLTQYSNVYKIVVSLKRNNNVATSGTYHIQVVKGTTVPAWSPYENICPISGHTGCDIFVKPEYDAQATPTVSISFGSTVYGGKLTVNEDGSGQIEADVGITTLDGAPDESWSEYPSFQGFYIPISSMKIGTRQYGISSMLVNSKSSLSGQKNAMWLGVNSNRIFLIGVYETMGDTVTKLREFLASNPIQVTFPLVTPITIPLTASQINTLVGENVVWVNAATGDITVQAYGTEIS